MKAILLGATAIFLVLVICRRAQSFGNNTDTVKKPFSATNDYQRANTVCVETISNTTSPSIIEQAIQSVLEAHLLNDINQPTWKQERLKAATALFKCLSQLENSFLQTKNASDLCLQLTPPKVTLTPEKSVDANDDGSVAEDAISDLSEKEQMHDYHVMIKSRMKVIQLHNALLAIRDKYWNHVITLLVEAYKAPPFDADEVHNLLMVCPRCEYSLQFSNQVYQSANQ